MQDEDAQGDCSLEMPPKVSGGYIEETTSNRSQFYRVFLDFIIHQEAYARQQKLMSNFARF